MRKTAVLLTILGPGVAGLRASVGGGEGVAALKNQNGAEMALTATGQGIRLALAKGGVDVKLKQ